MRRPTRRSRTAAALAGLGGLLATALAVVAPTAGPAAAADPLRYVAMGDSYSAASGVLPPDPTAAPQCLRSTRNYPHVLAERLGASLTDVTCGGADTGDYAAAQYPGVPPQLDALRADTQLVTMTIGGNDSGVFIDSILQCGVAGAVSLGLGSPCRDQYGDSFEKIVRDTTYPALVGALGAVRQRAPQARVLIVGYPSILPATGGCFPVMPVAAGDVPYLRSLQATLNDAVARAAAATGVTFVDMGPVSEGRDACQAIGTRWIEPVLAGTNPVIVHPNALGETAIAEQVLAALARTAPSLVGSTSRSTTRTTLRVKRVKGRAVIVSTVSSASQRRIAGAPLVLQKKTKGGAWVKVRRLTTGVDGVAQARPKPRQRTTYRVKAKPSALYAASTSRTRTLRP